MTDAVDLIIVTYNSRVCFARMKAALEALTYPFRLIVIDNDSRPEERPTAADFPAGADIHQMTTNTGFAVANNFAVARSQAPLIALLNPDAFPKPDWLAHLVAAAAREPSVASFGSTQIAAEDPSRFDGLGDCYHVFGIPWRGGYGWPVTTGLPVGDPFSACAAAALYRRDAWDAVGGFDERFFCYCEDVDLGFRLRLAGWRVGQVNEAVVHHIGGASSSERSDFSVYHGTRNRVWTFVKNMPAPAFWIMAPAHLAATLYLLARSGKSSGAMRRGLRDAVKGLGAMLAARRRIQRARTSSSWTLLAPMTWSPAALSGRAPIRKRSP